MAAAAAEVKLATLRGEAEAREVVILKLLLPRGRKQPLILPLVLLEQQGQVGQEETEELLLLCKMGIRFLWLLVDMEVQGEQAITGRIQEGQPLMVRRPGTLQMLVATAAMGTIRRLAAVAEVEQRGHRGLVVMRLRIPQERTAEEILRTETIIAV